MRGGIVASRDGRLARRRRPRCGSLDPGTGARARARARARRAAAREPGRRLRLSGLRLARESAAPCARVLRERREGGRQRGDTEARHRRLLRALLAPGARGAGRRLARGAGAALRADVARAGRDALRADRVGRRLRADRQPPAAARVARRGGVLHLGSHQQRGRLPVAAVRARVRHEQPPRLLEHVPRVERHWPGRVDRGREGHRRARRLRALRRHLRARPEPGLEPPAHAHGAASGQAARLRDRQHQPAARTRARRVREPAGGAGSARTWHAARGPLRAIAGRRRRRAAAGRREGAARARGRRPGHRARPRLHRRAHAGLRELARRSRRALVRRARARLGHPACRAARAGRAVRALEVA